MPHVIDTHSINNEDIHKILLRANNLSLQKAYPQTLKGKTILTIFFENSTRTLSSFHIAAKNLGGHIISIDISRSSTSKGESMQDTIANLNAMKPDVIIIRHKYSGTPKFLIQHVQCPIINGGDGAHEHPTQALLDLLTLANYYHPKNLSTNTIDLDLRGKKLAIIGDIKNSRVANSNLKLLPRFGVEITLIAPPHFLPKTHFPTSHNLREDAKYFDILMSLRTQTERHSTQTYGSLKDYAHNFCIHLEMLKKETIVLHPGPVHKNIDIQDRVFLDPRCKVLSQVSNGVFTRMAVLEYCLGMLN